MNFNKHQTLIRSFNLFIKWAKIYECGGPVTLVADFNPRLF